jgi:hypothetical protein
MAPLVQLGHSSMALEEIKMSSTDIFARSFQKTDIWLKQAARELKWRDRRKTYIALRAVLHALRDRVTNREAVQLGAQLPTVIRASIMKDGPCRINLRAIAPSTASFPKSRRVSGRSAFQTSIPPQLLEEYSAC